MTKDPGVRVWDRRFWGKTLIAILGHSCFRRDQDQGIWGSQNPRSRNRQLLCMVLLRCMKAYPERNRRWKTSPEIMDQTPPSSPPCRSASAWSGFLAFIPSFQRRWPSSRDGIGRHCRRPIVVGVHLLWPPLLRVWEERLRRWSAESDWVSDEFEEMELGFGEDLHVGGVDSGPNLCSGDVGVRLLRPPFPRFASPRRTVSTHHVTRFSIVWRRRLARWRKEMLFRCRSFHVLRCSSWRLCLVFTFSFVEL